MSEATLQIAPSFLAKVVHDGFRVSITTIAVMVTHQIIVFCYAYARILYR